MLFKKVPSQIDFVAQEHEVLEFWRRSQAFSKLVMMRAGGPKWYFLDGPITANNPMGIHHAWGRTYKDVWQRFKAMQGYDQRWQNGFDCQGLWVEVNVEKDLGFESKRDIEKHGLADFVIKCKQRVLKYAARMTEQSIRLGMWMDWNEPRSLLELHDKLGADPRQAIAVQGRHEPVTGTIEQIVGQLGAPELGGSYFTFSDENNYMIWTFLKRCWEKGWLYKGTDVMPWCARCGTGISQHEIVTDGYQELTHPSVYVRFPIRGREKEALLIWTTTPWTLTTDVAAAVHPDMYYVKVKQGEWVYYLAKNTAAEAMQGDHDILDEMPGSALVGLSYAGPYDELPAVREAGIPDAHSVVPWDEVSDVEGTGIVHISPGSGAEDFVLGKELGLPALAPLTEDGVYTDGFDWLTGRSVQTVAEDIFADLANKELLYRVQEYTHRYPVCWRCREELVFRLVDEWYISMGPIYDKPREELTEEEREQSLRYQIMDIAEQVKWVPAFGMDRELDWLCNMHDWMISKKRYWGLALPIWECPACEHFEVIGDERELEERAIEGWNTFCGHTPHRPYVDAVKIRCSECGTPMSRISDVGNPWLDAGIVPFSTLRYRADRAYFEKWFPGDFITESFPGQFRNWFYSVLAMSTVLEKRVPFKAVLGYALLLGEDGRPMHKSWGNAIDFDEGAEKIGVDVMRWMFCAHNPEANLLFGYHLADETRRQFLIPLWNIYSFFTNYAAIDGWLPQVDWSPKFDPDLAPIDRWIISRLQQVIGIVTEQVEEFVAWRATQELGTFIDDLSNWYVRRSRRRFWKASNDSDKSAAYATLYYVLTTLTKLLAPLAPFVTESMHQNLVRSVDPGAPESVHHCIWPTADRDLIDGALLDSMSKARQIASIGHSARNSAGIKLRQPLAKAKVYGCRSIEVQHLLPLIVDELNVKEIEFVENAEELVRYRLIPDGSYWGPVLQSAYPKLRGILEEMDTVLLAQKLQRGHEVPILVDEERSVNLSLENVSIRMEPVIDHAVATEGDLIAAVSTKIPNELAMEGLAREFVRRVQNLRKEADLELDARISIVYSADSDLTSAIEIFSDYICRETLGVSLTEGIPSTESAWISSTTIEGQTLVLGIRRADTGR